MSGLDWYVADNDLADLQRRLRATRWPTEWPEPGWSAGTDQRELRRLVAYWIQDYDWRRHERSINDLPHHYASINGVPLHFLRFDAERSPSVAILLTNGWPSTFYEMVELARRLATPSRFGRSSDVCFTVIVPSLPGFTFSAPRPTMPADVPTHELWSDLMRNQLGFDNYFAHGGDLGAGISSRLAAAHPDELLGLHLMAVGPPRHLDRADLSEEEEAYLRSLEVWDAAEGGYQHQQSTRPVSLAYGLTDSPAGLLGWILEKYRAWSDIGGGTSTALTDDFVLTQACLYWFTNSIGTSFRPYYEYGHALSRGLSPVAAPTAIALFPADLAHPPRRWAERTHNVVRYTTMPRGGHFAAIEVPDLLADDLVAFARLLDETT